MSGSVVPARAVRILGDPRPEMLTGQGNWFGALRRWPPVVPRALTHSFIHSFVLTERSHGPYTGPDAGEREGKVSLPWAFLSSGRGDTLNKETNK